MARRAGRSVGVFAFALLLAPPAGAQVLVGYLLGEKLASATFSMGFEIGLNFSTLDGLDGASRINRTAFGLFADWRFSEHVHLGGAVLPIAGRGAEGITPVPTGDPAIDAQARGATARRSIGCVELPVLLKWAPKRESGFRIGVGPSFAFVTGATDRYDLETPSGSAYVLERDIHGQLPGLDAGVSLDVEWRLGALSIAARYTQGLTDLRMPGESEAVHSRVLTGTGRIALGKKKPKP